MSLFDRVTARMIKRFRRDDEQTYELLLNEVLAAIFHELGEKNYRYASFCYGTIVDPETIEDVRLELVARGFSVKVEEKTVSVFIALNEEDLPKSEDLE